ncbi:unnamed protein product [Merluccius merluccius]
MLQIQALPGMRRTHNNVGYSGWASWWSPRAFAVWLWECGEMGDSGFHGTRVSVDSEWTLCLKGATKVGGRGKRGKVSAKGMVACLKGTAVVAASAVVVVVVVVVEAVMLAVVVVLAVAAFPGTGSD